MGGSERTWGSKGRASWKVTLSSRRWVLYRFGLPHPVPSFLGLVHHPLSRSHLFFCEPPCRFSLLPRPWPAPDIFHTHSALSPSTFPPPLFFPMRIRTLRGTPVSFPFRLCPRPPSLAPSSIGISNPPPPPFHPSSNTFLSRSLSLPLIRTFSRITHLTSHPLLVSPASLLDLRYRKRPHPGILRLLNVISPVPYFSHNSCAPSVNSFP
jgi:hypothetical protein